MKKILGALAVVLMIGACANTVDDKEEKVEDSTEQTESTEIVEEVKADEESSSEEPEVVEEEEESKEDDVPREYESALRKAESYLDMFSMSAQGVRDQLGHDEFGQDAIDYALENLETDWNEQAKKSAESYTELFDMSDAKLYDQLIYKGFTEEQAQAGVDGLYE